MKKLLLALALLFSIHTFSQDYIPMLQDDNVWHVLGVVCCDSGGSSPQMIENTILINDVEYKSLSLFGDQCYFREENGIVYVRGNDDQDYVYFDFTLEVGDTIDASDNENYVCNTADTPGGTLTVISTDTELIAGEMRRTITFDENAYNGLPIKWIEGIGSLAAGLYPFGLTVDISYYLVCFTNNETTTMFNGYDECVFLNVDDFLLNQIKIAPNPVTESTTLIIPQEISAASITVFDVNGKKLFEQHILEKNTTINFSSLQSGIYFYQIYSENNLIATKKLIVR